jgi:hypothetical protein
VYANQHELYEAELDELEGIGDEVDEAWEMDEVDGENVFSEDETADLAAELLEVSDEAELDQFLGGLISKVGRGIRAVARSPVGRAVGGVLRGAARHALPWAGRAIGTYFGGPAGGAIGGRLAAGAGRLLGLELEGLSPDVQEFEIAKKFVNFAGATARNALASGGAASPVRAALSSAVQAARRHAPGLVKALAKKAAQVGVPVSGTLGRPPIGGRPWRRRRWMRCHRCGCRIVIKGCGCR